MSYRKSVEKALKKKKYREKSAPGKREERKRLDATWQQVQSQIRSVRK